MMTLLLLATAKQSLSLGACDCQCILVDVGMNDGRSVQSWPSVATRFARELGVPVGYRQYAPATAKQSAVLDRLEACGIQTRSSCYMGFEANPLHTPVLTALQERMRGDGACVSLSTSTAFSVHDGHTTFYVQPASLRDGAVGSTLDNRKPVIADKRHLRTLNAKQLAQAHYDPQRIASRGMASLVRSVMQPGREDTHVALDATWRQSLRRLHAHGARPFFAIKMDLEGFEYTLLPQMLRRSQREELCKVDVLAIEWHERMMPVHSGKTAEFFAQLAELRCNVTVLMWP